MILRPAAVSALGLAAALLLGAASGPSPVAQLSGRYSEHWVSGDVQGDTFGVDDIAEVAPMDAGHAFVRLRLNFYNGHTCSLWGVAAAEGDALVYRGGPRDTFVGGPPCQLVLRREGVKLVWSDGDNSCKAHCGERGSLMSGSLRWSSRRPITYLPRLRASREYGEAMAEWRAAAPVSPPA